MVELPLQTFLAEPTPTVGTGFTVIVTESVLKQPVAVIVSVSLYVVFTVGLADGLLPEEVNPEGLLVQLYVCPATLEAPNLNEDPEQTDDTVPRVAEGKGFTLIDIDEVSFTLLESVTPFGLLVHILILYVPAVLKL